MPDEVLEEPPLSPLTPNPFPRTRDSSQPEGRFALAVLGGWGRVCRQLCRASASRYPSRSHITYRNTPSLLRTSALHPAWGQTYPKLIPERSSSSPSSAAPFLAPSRTRVVSQGLSTSSHRSWVVLLQVRLGMDAGELWGPQ